MIVSAASQAQRGFDWVTGQSHEEQESLHDNIQPVPSLAPFPQQELPVPPAAQRHTLRR